ncbi:MAG TPA: 50S ribosomal protein L17 [Dehalococcoidia bacterium]|nr:50S ribosomal protein L17 [Dehalococcoidia bacterium]
MRHRIAGKKLSRPTGHRMAMYYNLTTELLKYEKIATTQAKTKEVRGITEKVITLGKAGTLHARRQALAIVGDKKVIDKVFGELASRYATRSGGYTRIFKLGHRSGDGAPVAQIELVK